MRDIRCVLWPLLLMCSASLASGESSIRLLVDGTQPGRVFEGIGATSGGGATSRLLIDYPEPQRAQILDFLFKPHYGASLQLLKVEIGSDANSTEGAEPTHMRHANEQDFDRGYEWWLMKEAQRRNPAVKLLALAWNFPAWVGAANSQKAADYLVSYVEGARRRHGLTIDYLGIWNETRMDPQFIKLLRARLDAHKLETRIIADDSVNSWHLVQEMAADPQLRGDVDVIATHYPRFQSTEDARSRSLEWGKPLWSSEDGPWDDSWGAAGQQSPPIAELLNRNYIQGRITSTNIWNLVGAYYDIFELRDAGLLRAKWPWSGHYELTSPLWVVAHTTQFAQPGWRYIDSGSGLLPAGGSYVSLHNGADYSIVAETLSAKGPVRLDVRLAGGLSPGPVYVWRSNRRSWFERIARLEPRGGAFSLVLEPGSLYSITNTTGQGKGEATPPPKKPFPVPYRDDFESYSDPHATPRFLFEANGAFEIVRCGAGRSGRCLQQMADKPPIAWTYYGDWPAAGALDVLGDARWRNYRVGVDVLVTAAGYAAVCGRVSLVSSEGHIDGYQLRLSDSGQWELRNSSGNDSVVASGRVAVSRNAWRHLELAFEGEHITGSIDGAHVVSLQDSHNGAGLAGIGSGWNPASFDNLSVTPINATTAVIAVPPRPHVTAPPGMPELLVPDVGSHTVRLRWKSVPGATGYRVRIGTSPDRFDKREEAGNVQSYTFRTLTDGVKYYFDVAAWNAKGEGKHSAVQYAVPAPRQAMP